MHARYYSCLSSDSIRFLSQVFSCCKGDETAFKQHGSCVRVHRYLVTILMCVNMAAFFK